MTEELKSKLQLWEAAVLGAYLGGFLGLSANPIYQFTMQEYTALLFSLNPFNGVKVPFILSVVVGIYGKHPIIGFMFAFVSSIVGAYAIFWLWCLAGRC